MTRPSTWLAVQTARIRGNAPWLPFGMLAAWFLWQGLQAKLVLNLPSAVAAGLLGILWLVARRRFAQGLVLCIFLLPIVSRTAADRLIRLPSLQAIPAGAYLRVEGTVRTSELVKNALAPKVRIVLGEVTLWQGADQWALSELALELPGKSAWRFRPRKVLRVGGNLLRLSDGRQPLLALRGPDHHFRDRPLSSWRGDYWRVHLRDRAAYYLGTSALAVYLPVLLGVRETRTPEARGVVRAFRDLGLSHLFAISGLHVGLLYFIFLGLYRLPQRWLMRGQGNAWLPRLPKWCAMASVWAYIVLIGFPVPALRAAIMGTMLLWGNSWSLRGSRMHILALTALGFLNVAPTQLYDLSFQLSFLAYFFLVFALDTGPRMFLGGKENRILVLAGRLLTVAVLSLWVTAFITVGLLPIMAEVFGKISLLVFLGNLLMLPVLAYLVLPLGLLALGASFLQMGALPGGWVETGVFYLLEWVLIWWVEGVNFLAARGQFLIVEAPGSWGERAHFLYFTLLLAAAATLREFMERRRRFRMFPRRSSEKVS